jgi:hypothetical protein
LTSELATPAVEEKSVGYICFGVQEGMLTWAAAGRWGAPAVLLREGISTCSRLSKEG